VLVKTSKTLKGIAEVIESEIIPDLSSAYPKAQSHAIVSMLRNLAIWQEEQNAILSEENKKLEWLLKGISREIKKSNSGAGATAKLAGRIDKGLRSWSVQGSVEDYNSQLRELLDESLRVVSLSPGWNSTTSLRSLRKEIKRAVKRIIVTEMKLSTPSKMAEFSKGSK
jgi:hypothetical protein